MIFKASNSSEINCECNFKSEIIFNKWFSVALLIGRLIPIAAWIWLFTTKGTATQQASIVTSAFSSANPSFLEKLLF